MSNATTVTSATTLQAKTEKLIIESSTSLCKLPLTKETMALDILVRENATCDLLAYYHGNHPLSLELKIRVEENASLTLYQVIPSSENVNTAITCDLKGNNAQFENLNVVLLDKTAKLESLIQINHLAPNTKSNLEIYAIAKDNAKLTLNNNATIQKGCFKVVAHQKAKGLTLNPQATIKALPNLYIDEYDVIANHAASIGSLNPEDLFYLMSRGLSKEEASKIIIQGFINPLIEHIEDKETKELIWQQFMKKSSLD